MSQLFALGGQSIRAPASASVLPMNIQGWFPLELTDFIFLQSKGLSRVRDRRREQLPALEENVLMLRDNSGDTVSLH